MERHRLLGDPGSAAPVRHNVESTDTHPSTPVLFGWRITIEQI